MKVCTNCGGSIQEDQNFCPYCGLKIDQNLQNDIKSAVNKETTVNHIIETNAEKNANSNSLSNTTCKRRSTALSIIAFVFSFTSILSPIAIVLAIIDLIKNKGRRHGFSIAALIIGCLLSFVIVIGIVETSKVVSTSNGTNNLSVSATDRQTSKKTPKAATATPRATNKPTSVPTPTVDPKEQFVNSCEVVVYQEVERSPNSFKGKNIHIEGKIVQVLEGWFDTVTYRVATNKNGRDDVWYVTYSRQSDESRVLEGDYVTIYGVCNGIETYRTVLGSSITIPAIKAKYIEVNTKASN